MIKFSETSGADIWINPVQVVSVSAWGDNTVLTLADGHRRVVDRPLADVLGRLGTHVVDYGSPFGRDPELRLA